MTQASPQVILRQRYVRTGQALMEQQNTRSSTTIPGTYVSLVLNTMRGLNLPERELNETLQQQGIDINSLATPNVRISLETVNELLKLVFKHENQYVFAAIVGTQMKLSSHGFIGFAAMTAKNVREALDIAIRYVPLIINGVNFRLENDGETAHFYIEENITLHPLREMLLIAVGFGFITMGEVVTGKKLFGNADVDFPSLDEYEKYESYIPGVVHFNQPFNRVSFSASYLDLPLVMSDPIAMQLAREQCERELAALGRDQSFLQRARNALFDDKKGFLSAEQLAQKLHVSSRTLKRQLSLQNTTYSDILEDARCKKAVLLLEQQNLSIEEIAEKLGYSDVANFSRAFKRWTGQSPNAYRKSRGN